MCFFTSADYFFWQCICHQFLFPRQPCSPAHISFLDSIFVIFCWPFQLNCFRTLQWVNNSGCLYQRIELWSLVTGKPVDWNSIQIWILLSLLPTPFLSHALRLKCMFLSTLALLGGKLWLGSNPQGACSCIVCGGRPCIQAWGCFPLGMCCHRRLLTAWVSGPLQQYLSLPISWQLLCGVWKAVINCTLSVITLIYYLESEEMNIW